MEIIIETNDVRITVFGLSTSNKNIIVESYKEFFQNEKQIAIELKKMIKITYSEVKLNCELIPKFQEIIYILRNIKVLELIGTSEKIADFITKNKENLKFIEDLSISTLRSNHFGILSLFNASHLKSISIHFDDLENSIEKYLDYLKSLDKLESLDFNISFRTNDHLYLSINKTLRRMTNLKNLSLNVEKCYETTSYLTILSETLSSMTQLETLCLEYNCKPQNGEELIGEELINSLDPKILDKLKKLTIPLKKGFDCNSLFHNLMSLEIISDFSFQNKNALIENNDSFANLKELIFKKEVNGFDHIYLEKFLNLEKFSFGPMLNGLNYIDLFVSLGRMEKLNDLDLTFSFFNSTISEININDLNNHLIMIISLISLRISLESNFAEENKPYNVGDFSQLTQLTNLTLELKEINIIDFQMKEHKNLKKFDFRISKCKIEKDIKLKISSFLTNSKNLETFCLNTDEDFPLDFLKNLDNLKKLTLRMPKPIEVNFPQSLSYLNLCLDNYLSFHISYLSGLKNLKHLILPFVVANEDNIFDILQHFFNKQKEYNLETLELNEIYDEREKIRNLLKNLKGVVKLKLGTNIFFQ